MTRLAPLKPLKGAQLAASRPRVHAALSASAGTGKTHVLTARVLRLLLNRAAPESILCLTFTKAGAAEMAERIHSRLAAWVRMPDNKLSAELFALGEPHDPPDVARARTLFASVLDATGGGLRIQTIHAFSQTLLAQFPAEAGLAPGFQPLDARGEGELARRVLGELLENAERNGDQPLIRDVQALSERLGEAEAERMLHATARAPDAMAALGSREGIEAKVRRHLDVPAEGAAAALRDACGADCFWEASLKLVAAANRTWGAASGHKRADLVEAWLSRGSEERAETLGDLAAVWLTGKQERRKIEAKLAAGHPAYESWLDELDAEVGRLLTMQQAEALATFLSAALRAGQTYARAYAEAKTAAGVVDFDDLIRLASGLLAQPGMGDWIRYKLDQRIDHVLVDEAQDTNTRQWRIVSALVEEFFQIEWSGRDAERPRTLFTVGDFKQAIFGFQGTDPLAFEAAQDLFEDRARNADQPFDKLDLERSFRSAPPVLDLVDQLVSDLGRDALGLAENPTPHRAHHDRRPGSVELLPPYTEQSEVEDEAEGEEAWVPGATRGWATRLAKQVKAWLTEAPVLACKGRPLKPEDILILVRKRSDLAGLIVARLHAENVPVAGVDRLRLNAPLAVRDLLAAVRFAVQPEDDLNLANLLVSPLIGWSYDELTAVAAPRPPGHSLWRAVREAGDVPGREHLDALLAQADLVTPHAFIEGILSGPMQGRAKLLARLGAEARDPIEELVTAALDFEGSAAASLGAFLDWFERGEVDIVRDPSSGGDAVRVMTVHGAKGLQAPVVVLADATVDPADSPRRHLEAKLDGLVDPVPLPRPRKAERVPPLDADLDAQDKRERQEHWRLLYVAATRAEERLVIGGALGGKRKGQVPAESWYAKLKSALEALGPEEEDGESGPILVWRGRHNPETPRARKRDRVARPDLALPDWLHRPAPAEARPPRPLAPSSLGPDDAPDPPPTPEMRAAARRGSILHSLFERLPGCPPAERRAAGERWLQGAGGVADAAERDTLLADALRIIDDPAFADLFGPDALAEAPFAATLPDGTVVAGTVDRLLVTPTHVRVVDFKTGRVAPASADAIPPAYLRQMRAYREALGVIFPGRTVEAGLLFTAGPVLYPA